MILHPRHEWQLPTQPVTGPKITDWSSFVDNVVHYPGSGPNANYNNPVATFRAIQADYLRTRGYSIGYSFGIDPKGEAWELRGLDIKPAATAGYNNQGLATFLLVPGVQPANEAQIATFVEIHLMMERKCGKDLGIFGHGQRGTTATPCPGAGIYGQLNLLRSSVQAAKTPIPDTQGEIMYLFRGPSGQMYATNRDYKDRPIGFAVNEEDGAMLRDVYGYQVGPDTGPWPIDGNEERVIRAIAGLGV